MAKIQAVIRTLMIPEPLADSYHDHNLTGNQRHYRECHIAPDWLLIYRYEDDELLLDRTGTHADLFGM